MRLEVLAGIGPALATYVPERMPGAVVLVDRAGQTVLHEAIGEAVRYADAEGTVLPAEQRVPMTPDTIFDLASVSKLFTSIVALQQVDAGRVELNAPVRMYLPEFGATRENAGPESDGTSGGKGGTDDKGGKGGKDAVTVRHLLTHTSGLPSWLPLYRDWPERESRLHAALTAEPIARPGEVYAYSDLNMITLGVLVERVTGASLDELVATGITDPLGMVDTGYCPPSDKLSRIAATEFRFDSAGGAVRGEVHDENAWSLGGVAGHAGVFSTAADLAVLGRALLGGGAYGRARILSPRVAAAMLCDANASRPGDAHGLGFELDQRWFMGDLAGPRTAGHTGFTGTSLVCVPDADAVVVLLTNRVHPSRELASINPVRRHVANLVAAALGRGPATEPVAFVVRPGPSQSGQSKPGQSRPGQSRPGQSRPGQSRPGQSNPGQSKPGEQESGEPQPENADRAEPDGPVVEVPVRRGSVRVAFDLVASAPDAVLLELSRDSGASWQPVPVTNRSRGDATRIDARRLLADGARQWVQAFAEFEVGDQRGAIGAGPHAAAAAQVDGDGVDLPAPALLRWRAEVGDAYVSGVRFADAAGPLPVVVPSSSHR